MNSIWLEHPKYPGYRFSPEGKCLSIKNKPKILKDRIKRCGYIQWRLNDKDVISHRVIAEIYIKNTELKPQVNHKNGIKTDNRIENIEWCTRSENQRHSVYVLKKDFSHRRGEKSNFSKLKTKQVLEIKKELSKKEYGIVTKMAKRYNVSKATISMIKSGKIWIDNLKNSGVK